MAVTRAQVEAFILGDDLAADVVAEIVRSLDNPESVAAQVGREYAQLSAQVFEGLEKQPEPRVSVVGRVLYASKLALIWTAWSFLGASVLQDAADVTGASYLPVMAGGGAAVSAAFYGWARSRRTVPAWRRSVAASVGAALVVGLLGVSWDSSS